MNITEQEQMELEKLSGFSNSKARPNWPSIKFHGITGAVNIFTSKVDANGQRTFDTTEIPENPALGKGALFDITVLRERRTLAAFEQVGARRVKTRYWTDEFEGWESRINLWKKSGDDKAEKIMTGTPTELREKYPSLKTKKILYVLYKNEIHKFSIKGGNLKVYSAWLKTMNGKPYTNSVVITTEDKTNEAGIKYKALVFATGEPTDLKLVLEKMREVNEVLEDQDKRLKQNDDIEKELSLTKKDDLPVIDVDDDKVRPEDIEF